MAEPAEEFGCRCTTITPVSWCTPPLELPASAARLASDVQALLRSATDLADQFLVLHLLAIRGHIAADVYENVRRDLAQEGAGSALAPG